MVEQRKSHGGTLWWKSVIKQSKQSWCNSVVQHLNSHGGTVWWKSGPVIVEQCGGTVEQWNSDVGTVEQKSWNSGTVER